MAKAKRSQEARRKDCSRKTLEGELPLRSFPDLLESLGALAAVELESKPVPGHAVPTLSKMTPLQKKAFDLLGLWPHPAPWLSPKAAGWSPLPGFPTRGITRAGASPAAGEMPPTPDGSMPCTHALPGLAPLWHHTCDRLSSV